MKSIGFKLWAGMMALVAVVLLLLWLFQIVFLESFYTRMRIAAVKSEGAAIAGLLAAGGEAAFQGRLDAFAYQNNLSAGLLDSSGESLYTTGSNGAGWQIPMHMSAAARGQAFEAALSGQEAQLTLTHPRLGSKFLLIGLPVQEANGSAGVLLLNLPLAPVEDTALILKKQLFYLIPVLLAAALLLSLLLSRSFARPILAIQKTAGELAAGNFSARVDLKQQDEIGQLAGTINHLGHQLAQIEQLRRDLIANVSHELRTPLSIIRGYAETLRDVSGDDPAKRARQLEIIVAETERLSKIVDDILNLSQLQSGLGRLQPQRFDLQQALAAVVKRYAVLSEQTGVQVLLPEAVMACVEADRTRIEQVLDNLISNGLHHTPPGGRVTLQTQDRGQAVRFEVADTGSGIPAEELAHIWDRYYKADKTSGRSSLGSGLGLAIVKSILEAHGAAYGVASQDGAGTTFWFELPKA